MATATSVIYQKEKSTLTSQSSCSDAVQGIILESTDSLLVQLSSTLLFPSLTTALLKPCTPLYTKHSSSTSVPVLTYFLSVPSYGNFSFFVYKLGQVLFYFVSIQSREIRQRCKPNLQMPTGHCATLTSLCRTANSPQQRQRSINLALNCSRCHVDKDFR